MKKVILTACFLGLFGTTHAQAFKIGENRASFCMGFGWVYKENLNNSVHFPSPNALVERSIIPFENVGLVSVGAQFGFHHGYHNGTFNSVKYKQSWTSVYFVPRVALYFHELFDANDFTQNIDLYAGLGIGFNFLSHKIPEEVGLPDSDRNGFNLGYNIFAGGRYYFKPHASAFAEIGYGLSVLNAGITIRY
jgi:hypothetical protein